MPAKNENIPDIKFYKVSRDYTSAMRFVDKGVQFDNYQDEGRAEKFYVGPLPTSNGVDYYVPMSHQTEKQPNPYSSNPYYVPIKDKDGKTIATMDFRHSIPIDNKEHLHELTPQSEYAKKEYAFCQRNQNAIRSRASRAFNDIKNAEKYDDKFLQSSAIDMDRIEDGMWQYELFLEKKEEALQNAQNVQKMNDRADKAAALTQDIDYATAEFKDIYIPYDGS